VPMPRKPLRKVLASANLAFSSENPPNIKIIIDIDVLSS
jgi:hypothetical protein